MRYRKISVLTIFLFLVLTISISAEVIKNPSEYLRKEIGADYTLANWDEIVSYFEYLASVSDRVIVSEIGKSTEGRPMIMATITDEKDIPEIEHHRLNQKKLANPTLIKSSEEEYDLVNNSKVAVLIMCQQHSTEIASSQMSMLLAYELATNQEDAIREILQRTIILLVPCANPDGHDMVVKYYNSTIGTPFEGGRLPFLYQKYAGHDNNRDWFMLNLKETRAITRVLYNQWYPTILWDVHQTGKSSYRLFVPPFYNPKNPNTHPLIDKMLYVVGGTMAADLAGEGKTGVAHSVTYDNYWAGGGRTTPHRHNILALLTEAASVNIATPVFQSRNQLRGTRRGMPEYEMSANFPDPWPGGWWHLRDIIDYELIASKSLLRLAARYHDLHQRNYLMMGRDAIKKGQSEPPFAYLIPPDQTDHRASYELLWRLKASGIEIYRTNNSFKADGISYPAGTYILYCSQPYRPHLIDMMARQFYPERSLYPGGPAEPPYDVSGWTLPIMLGVNYVEVRNQFIAQAEKVGQLPDPQPHFTGSSRGNFYLFSMKDNDSYKLLNRLTKANVKSSVFVSDKASKTSDSIIDPGSIIVKAKEEDISDLAKTLGVKITRLSKIPGELSSSLVECKKQRIALYQPWFSLADEGWTRYILDHYEFEYSVIHNSDIRASNLSDRFDVIILPSVSDRRLISGNPPGSTFEKYTGGIGNLGILNLQKFTEEGGRLVCIDESCDLPVKYFNIPVENALEKVKSDKFYCPGALLRLDIDNTHPVGYGMEEHFTGYFVNSQAFDILSDNIRHKGERQSKIPTKELPENTKKITEVAAYSQTVLLESGWLRGDEYISGKPAILEIDYGKGKIELLGIRVQHRAQTQATFKILFNALLFGSLSG